MLEVKHISKQFGDYKAVQDVSFTASAGEIFGLLGPNGAGKTSTIRVVATVLSPTEGTATVCGFDICKNPVEVRKNLGLLTSDIGLYDRFSARENLRYFGNLYGMQGEALEQRIEKLIDVLDMKAFADRRAGKFSTGMKQKVAIARSIIHDPKVIIFDEPTSGLDVLASQTVIRYMQDARKEGKVVILSTHDMAHAEKLCDRVAIMHKGKIITIDTIPAILQKTGTTNLEEAFLHIIGAEGAKAVVAEHEAEHLAKVEKKKKKFGLRFRL